MKTIRSILIAIAFISIATVTNELKAQDIYKTNADTVRLTKEYYLLAKTDGDIWWRSTRQSDPGFEPWRGYIGGNTGPLAGPY